MKIKAGMAAAVVALMTATGASAQTTIQPGATVAGTLSAGDRQTEDGSYYDCFVLHVPAGERVTVRLLSNDFDAFLAIVRGGCDGPADDFDDDGAGGTDAEYPLGPGRHVIRATSLVESETGSYFLYVVT